MLGYVGVIVAPPPAGPSGPLNGPQLCYIYVTDDYYVTDPTTNSVYRVNDQGLVAGPIAVGNSPGPVVCSPLTPYSTLVGNTADSTFSVIVPSTNTVSGTHALAGTPYGMGTMLIGPSTHYYAFTAFNTAGESALIAEASPYGVTTETLGAPGVQAAFATVNTYTGLQAYVSDWINGNVYVLGMSGGTYPPPLSAVRTLTGLSKPWGIFYSQTGYQVYIANSGSNTVSVYSLATSTITGTITVGNSPMGMNQVEASSTFYLYVANYADDTVSVINCSTNVVVATIPVGRGPVGVSNGVAKTGGAVQIAVANSLDRTVSFIDPVAQTVIATVSL